jgi:hypothetical protein
MAEWPLGAAIRAVRQGLSGRAGLAAYRAGGGRIGDSTWFRLFGEVRGAVAARPAEMSAPLNRRPTSEEMLPFSNAKRPGVLQQVEVYARDMDTGEIEVLPFSVVTPTGVTRQAAVDEALDVFDADVFEGYRLSILGAVHVSAFAMASGA